MVERAGGHQPEAGALSELTPREREVLRLVAEGQINAWIVEGLVVSEHTIHRRVTKILRKPDLPSGAAAAATRAGWLARR